MPPSPSRASLDPAVKRQLLEAIKLRLPPGQPLTLDAAEEAVVELLRELGPTLLEELLAGEEGSSKKGALRSAAAAPRSSRGCGRGRC
jgi:hypothetical protein